MGREGLSLEIQDALKREGASRFFNNFYDLLPFNRGESIEEIETWSDLREMAGSTRCGRSYLKQLDIPHRDLERHNVPPPNNFSERYLVETPRMFFHTIDKVIEDLGIQDPLRYVGRSDEEQHKAYEERVLLPIYTRLREMGYNHRELTQ